MRTMTRALVALVVLAACSTAATTTEPAPEETTTTATPETTAESAPAASGAEIVLTSGELGEYLSDGDGNTLYLFLPDDASGESTCYDTCEANWPPLGEAVAGDRVDAALLGTTTRADGSVQATYGGWPLYYFGADAVPGDVNGQGVNDVWFVVSPGGDAVGAG